MSAIETYLQYIANKVWARDVRTAIVNAIRQCYDDVHNPTLNTEALQAAIQAKIDAGQMAALTIGDRTITAAKLALGVIPTPDATLSQSGVPADAKTAGDEITALKADLGDVSTIKHEMGDLGWREITFTPDSFINLSGSTADVTQMTSPGFGFSCAVVMCSPGDKFLLNLTGGGRARAWGFVKGDKSIIAVADENVTVNNLTITAPDGAMYLVLNDNSGRKSYKNAKTVVDTIKSLEEQVGVFHWNNRSFIILNVDPVDLTPTVNSGLLHTVVDCSQGDKFIVTAKGGNQSRAWGFIDQNNHVLSVADASITVNDLEITAPENAKKLIVNTDYTVPGRIYKVGDNLTYKVERYENPVYNAKKYGCIGDGSTNDAPAIQTLLNKIRDDGGGEIYFPPGTYKVNSCLILFSNTTITLDKGAKLIRGAEINFMLLSNCTDSTLAYNGIKNIVIRGGTIDIGTGFTQGSCAAGFIHAQNILIENVEVLHNNSGYHMLDICGCKNVKVKNCYLHDSLSSQSSAELIQIDGAGSRVQFPSPQLTTGAETFDWAASINVEISGCVFELNSYSPAFGNHNAQANKNIDIHDNIITGTGGDRGAVAFAHNNEESTTNRTTQVIIHHNIFEGCNIGFTFSTVGTGKIYVRDNIFKGITTLKKYPNSQVGEFLNNIELE